MARICLGCGDIVEQSKDGYGPCCRQTYVRQRNSRPTHTARTRLPRSQRLRVLRRDGNRCVDCGTTEDLTIDHVVPLIEDPSRIYCDADLITRCRSHNSARGGGLSRGGTGYRKPSF